jgi:type IV secretion system protein VirB10
MFRRALVVTAMVSAGIVSAQDQPPGRRATENTSKPADSAQPVGDVNPPEGARYTVEAGTRVPLTLINSISTKHSAQGDRVYLETAFPILVSGKIVIPPGSYVAGTVTEVKRPGRVKGRGELYVRFDSLTLPNGVTRDFRARMGSMDATSNDELDRKEGTVKSEGNKAGDAATVAEAAGAGTSVGVIAGSAAGHTVMGAGIGAAAGAAAGMMAVLLSRGPDAVLSKGTTMEMVTDRPLDFSETELNFGNYQPPRMAVTEAQPASGSKQRTPLPRGRFPF